MYNDNQSPRKIRSSLSKGESPRSNKYDRNPLQDKSNLMAEQRRDANFSHKKQNRRQTVDPLDVELLLAQSNEISASDLDILDGDPFCILSGEIPNLISRLRQHMTSIICSRQVECEFPEEKQLIQRISSN